MKYILWKILFLSTAFIAFPSYIISQWNFSSLPPDASTSTGRTAPSMGTGTVTLLGGVTESFVAGGAKDPASADNSSWSVSKFPQVMVSNRMAGVRFQASTAGFERISIGWSQQNSGSASRYARVQYSMDGVTFEDLPAYAILKESTWTNLVFDLAPPNITIGGWGANRTVSVRAGTVSGSSMITVRVIDSGGKSNAFSFVVTVLAADTPPLVGCLSPVYLLANGSAGPLSFTVQDFETPAEDLAVNASALDSTLLPGSGLQFSGAGSNRVVVITPTPGCSGVTPVRLEVSDGANVTQCSFACVVLPQSGMLLYDSFNYPNGGLTTNSGQLWLRRSGSTNDMLVSNGRLQMSQARTEDVALPLHDGPYETGSNTALYVSFKLQVPILPVRRLPEYFAHLVSGGTTLSKLYIGTNTAVEGTYRLSITNVSAGALVPFPMSMNRNVLYTVVARYDIDAGAIRLWVNPQTEASPSVTATDSLAPSRVNSFGFRQSAGIGDELLIDELKIGRTFASVTGLAAGGPTLRWSRSGAGLSFSWDDPQFRLQSGASPAGPFTNVPGAVNPWPIAPAGKGKFFRLSK